MICKAVIIPEESEILSAFTVARPHTFMPGRFIQFIDGVALPAVTNSRPFFLVIRCNENDLAEVRKDRITYPLWNNILLNLLFIECADSVKLLNSTALWKKSKVAKGDIGQRVEITGDFKGKLQVLRNDGDTTSPVGIIEEIELAGECEYVRLRFL